MVKQYLVIMLLMVSCYQNASDVSEYNGPDYLLKTEIHQGSKFYREFDMFERKGVEQLTGDTLYFPFLAVKSTNDSIMEVTLFTKDNTTNYKIPKDDRVYYQFHNIGDGARHVFTKITRDTIMSYGYLHSQKEVEESGIDTVNWDDIVPAEIKIITKDSIRTYYFGQCLAIPSDKMKESGVALKDVKKYWIKPFASDIKSGCRDKVFSTKDERIQKAENFQYWFGHYGEN